MKIKVKTLLEMLQEDTNPDDYVRIDVKRVDSCQDFGKIADIYWDEDLVIEIH